MLMLSLFSCKPNVDLPTVERVDIQRYLGLWYEIGRLPNSFEKDMTCVTAHYSLKDNGKIAVLNKGYLAKDGGKFNEAKGTAWVPDAQFPGRLKVSFFWPFAGDYYIISLDENYQYVLVGDPSRKYMWVLSRTKILDDSIYNSLLEIAKNKGFAIENIIKVDQDCVPH
jgi:apolipoprotein D and lipocalin family protein